MQRLAKLIVLAIVFGTVFSGSAAADTTLGRARHNYDRLVHLIHLPNPPELNAVPAGLGYASVHFSKDPTTGEPVPDQSVDASPHLLRRLAVMDPTRASNDRFAVLHETGHTRGIYSEGGANHFANKWSRWLNRRFGKGGA